MAETNRLELTERRYGIYLWGFIASTLIALLTLLIVILWVTDQLKYHSIIIFLIILFIILAFASMVFVELQRRKAARRREQSAHEWVRRTFNQDQRKIYPSNSVMDSRNGSWTKWNPWRKSRSASPPRYETM